jgi:hypothetical protein
MSCCNDFHIPYSLWIFLYPNDKFYVFEDPPTVMTLSGLTMDDASFFHGSVQMSMELVFERDPPTFDREGGSVSAVVMWCSSSTRTAGTRPNRLHSVTKLMQFTDSEEANTGKSTPRQSNCLHLLRTKPKR